MMADEAEHLRAARYRIVESRDARFDGQFVMAVHSTGVYCRPSCPARTPRPTGVTFYPTSAAAHLAGYRACKRCLPDASPGTPEWDVREDAAGRAMRLLLDGVVEREGVPGLARRVGYSERQLNRIMTVQLGAGPKALSRARRAQLARALLTGSELPIADVAFAAGFASVRQFNATIREIFAMTPTELRAHRRLYRPTDGDVQIRLPVRRPFDAQGIFDWHAVHALPGLEQATTDASGNVVAYGRLVELPGGPAWFRASQAKADRRRTEQGIDVTVRLTDLRDLPALVARIRGLFDLDADPVAVDDVLCSVPELAASARRVPGIRVPGAVDPHELVVRILLAQQVSLASARGAQTALLEALGEPVPDSIMPGGRLFPSAERIALEGRSVLRGPSSRIETVVRVAEALADGSLVVDGSRTVQQLRDSLVAIRGVGPWTADCVALRVRHHPDLFLHTDLAVRRGAHSLGLPGDPRSLSVWSQQVAPWRSYLTMHCWRPSIERAVASFRARRAQPRKESS